MSDLAFMQILEKEHGGPVAALLPTLKATMGYKLAHLQHGKKASERVVRMLLRRGIKEAGNGAVQ